MQGAASISLLLMSLCTQPGLAQEASPTKPAAPQAVATAVDALLGVDL